MTPLRLDWHGRPTKPKILLDLLVDHRGHSTKELVRRVGHTFGGAKKKLVDNGFPIVREKHPTLRYQSIYTLLERRPNR